ncbi:MAG: hypothetical protein N2B06_19260 [Clostridium sp.]|tara:strand:+ start:292 stop:1953 length:1662 start_codon:yes stop_codon:yes gene_type:complete
MAAIIEVKFFNTFILKKSNGGAGESAGTAIWNGSFGIPQELGGYKRTSPQAGVSDDPNNWAIEESRVRGGFNNTSTDYGAKAYLVEDEPNQSDKINTLIYSGIFNSRTGINKTNVFSVGEDITKSLDPVNGSVQKLYAEDTNLNIFQELKVSRALIDKDAIYSAEGGGTVTSSTLVIGAIQPYLGDYGISTNPESFAIYGFNKYFSDSNKNVILRLSRSGIDEISSLGMKDYFRDELNRIKVASSPGKVIGGWDIYTSQYFISTQKNAQLTSIQQDFKNTTLAWDERINGWTSFFSFKPDQIFSIRNQMYTTKDGGLWLHNSNENIIGQASVVGDTFSTNVFLIDNILGDIRLGDIVYGPNVSGGTFVTGKRTTATGVEVALNVVSSLTDNTQLNFSNLARNKFYGVNNNSSITFVFNDNPSVSKTFKTINYEGYNGWQVDSFVSDPVGEDNLNNSYSFSNDSTSSVLSYDEGQYTVGREILRSGFDRKENKYYAYLKNSSTPVAREIHFGEEITGIKAFYAVVKMSNDVSTDFGGEKQLFQVGSEYSFNNGY